MKVKILVSCSGVNFSFKIGDVIDVTEELGKDLINAKYAEEVKTESKPKSKAGAKAGDKA